MNHWTACPAFFFALWLVGMSAATPAARADSLTIHLNPDQSLNLQLQAATNKDYALQTNSNLVEVNDWTNVLTGATDAAGQWTTNATIPVFSQLFYRSMSLPELSATTTAATGNGNTTFPITLGGTDPLFTNSTLQAVITQLPAHGQLLQKNNSLITTIPTLVSDASNVVLFKPETNVVATNYDTFSYLVKRATNGVTSPAQAVAVSVAFAPLAPILPFFTLQTTEDVAIIFSIKAYDPSPPPGAEPLTNIIVSPCVVGRLYQVLPDNVSQGSVILSTEVVVANTNQLVMYVPPLHLSGPDYESFYCQTENRYGQLSETRDVPISITHVNHAPVADNENVTGNNDDPFTEFNVLATDIDDGDKLSIYFTQLPTNGTLYKRKRYDSGRCRGGLYRE
ncbi:MAG TPA: Ig-like domain-containing protein [Verrucomicrobiae bacterium]